MQQRHDPKPSAIMQQFCFTSRTCCTGESIAAFLAELCQLAEHCECGTTLNDMLRDQLVSGVDDFQMQ